MAEQTRPPRPDCDFDFNLPHGVDVEDASVVDQYHIDDAADQAHDARTPMEDVQRAEINDDRVNSHDQDSAQQVMDYATLAAGFSDDEGGEEAFNRSLCARRTTKPLAPIKKSPRRWEDGDGDDEASPTKRARQSLFSGPVVEHEVEEEHVEAFGENLHAPAHPDLEIDDGMSSLHIDPTQELLRNQAAQDPGAIDENMRVSASERDSMSPAPSLVPSDDDFRIPPDTQPAYALRQNIDRLASTTYVDNDKTGNYDPSQEGKKAKDARSRALLRQKEKTAQKEKEKSKSKKKGRGRTQEDPEPTEKCIAKLRFESLGDVRNIFDDQENWPSGHSDIDSDWEAEVQKNRAFYRRNTPGVQQVAIDDPCGELDDLTGHPKARGCQECRESEKDCAMVHGGTFPCAQCLEDGLECKTIMRPIVKGGCERCSEEGEECSFGDDPNQSSCDLCNFGQHVCIPMPPHDYRTPRISLDEILYGPDRRHVQCTVCRKEKKRCSLKKKTDRPPCKHCKKNGLGCNFDDIPEVVVEKQPAKKKKVVDPTRGNAPEVSWPDSNIFSAADLAEMYSVTEREIVRETTPAIEMEDEAGNKGMLKKIRTSYANPITFNFLEDYTPDCSFCEMPIHGLVGYFEREVHVIAWDSGFGYTEVGGGHCAERGDPDKMCKDCVYMRLQIICCPGHFFESLPDVAGPLDFDATCDEIMNAQPGSIEFIAQQQRWCSLCFTPATVGCGTIQTSVAGGDDDEVSGCGARLCDGCFYALQGKYLGDFQHLATDMASKSKTCEEEEGAGEIQGKPRADVDFIRQEGLLARCIGADHTE